MAVTAEKYIELAKRGDRLSSAQRRHALQFLKVHEPQMTNFELAEMFRVSTRQIRLDKQQIKKRAAEELAEDDIGLIVVDIRESIKNQILALEISKKSCKPGTRDYLEHCKAIADLELKMTKALQDLGYYPKDLGTMTVKEYKFEAKVGLGGHTEVHQVRDISPEANREFEPDYNGEDIQDAEFEDVEPKQLTDGSENTDEGDGTEPEGLEDSPDGEEEEPRDHSGSTEPTTGSPETT